MLSFLDDMFQDKKFSNRVYGEKLVKVGQPICPTFRKLHSVYLDKYKPLTAAYIKIILFFGYVQAI